LAGGAFVRAPRSDRITRENWERINADMSRAELEAILGPPGDYTTGPTELVGNVGHVEGTGYSGPSRGIVTTALAEADLERWIWYGDAGEICVDRWSGGCMKTFHPERRVDQGPLDNLLWRIQRQWRKWFPE
jgi:hypothetical protein